MELIIVSQKERKMYGDVAKGLIELGPEPGSLAGQWLDSLMTAINRYDEGVHEALDGEMRTISPWEKETERPIDEPELGWWDRFKDWLSNLT